MPEKFAIFISWAKPRSRAIAQGLAEWLPDVIQFVDPFVSPQMTLGIRWSEELENRLRCAMFGIVCATPENLDNAYLNWEIGQLSYEKARKIVPFLLGGLRLSDIGNYPLHHFQAVLLPTKEDIFRVVSEINVAAGEPLDTARLERNFRRLWPEFQKVLDAFEHLPAEEERSEPRNQVDVLEQLLVRMGAVEQAVRYGVRREFALFKSGDRVMKALYAHRGVIHLAARELGLSIEAVFDKVMEVLKAPDGTWSPQEILMAELALRLEETRLMLDQTPLSRSGDSN
jgi:hypothetical protein